ncbi:MAG: MFS transporter [Alphaproteobacteria bacterium]|jgi:predicted MFS family arabinose efflux permease|nr:MFS transporter [Alphaproteobacteria bacterium]
MNRVQVRLSVALVAVLLAALTALSLRASGRAETLLLPEITVKAETVGRSVAGLVDRALEVGIPVDRMVGVDAYLQGIVDAHPDLAAITVRGAGGDALYAGGVARPDMAWVDVPVPGEAATALSVSVGLDPAFAREIVYKLWIDLAIVMVVTALVALELVYISFGVGRYGAIEGVEQRLSAVKHGDLRLHPPVESTGVFGDAARRIDARLQALADKVRALRADLAARADGVRQAALDAVAGRYRLGESVGGSPLSAISIRAPLFVFMFAEELTRPFLPIYIQGLSAPIAGLSPAVVTSLPMVVFLAIVALAQPVLGTVTERAGRRRSLMTGAALGAAGYVATGFAYDLLGLTIARALTAIGFALVFVAAQGFVIDATDTRQRARGMAVFIGAILVAGLCGPPIGGILAERLGMATTFLIAGGFAVASLLLTAIALPRTVAPAKHAAMIGWRDLSRSLSSVRLATLLFLCALPAKLVLFSVGFFLVPLHMEATGHDQAAIGRLLMIYPLAMVVLVPVFASLADRDDRRVLLVASGGLLAGLGTLLVLGDPENVFVLAAMLLLLGLGQAMSIAPQSALVGAFGKKLATPVSEGAVYGVFRLIERSGSALGPVLGGLLLGLYGFSTAVMLIGLAVALGAALFGLTVMAVRRTGEAASGDGLEKDTP